MILETMTPLDFMDFRLVSKYLITIYLIAKHGYKKTKLFLGKCYFNAWWLTRQNIRLGLSSDVRGNLHRGPARVNSDKRHDPKSSDRA